MLLIPTDTVYRDVLLRHHSSCSDAVGGKSVRRLSSAAKGSTKKTPPDVPENPQATPSLDKRPNIPDDWMLSDSQSTFMPADVSLAGFTGVAESADEAERGRSNTNGKPDILSQPIRTTNKRGRYVTKAW